MRHRLVVTVALATTCLAAGFVLGYAHRALETRSPPPSRAPAGLDVPVFVVDRPDATADEGRSIKEFQVYRITSNRRGVVYDRGNPSFDLPHVVSTDLPDGERITYFGVRAVP